MAEASGATAEVKREDLMRESDVVNAYALLLGRAPESAAVDERVGEPRRDLIVQLASSAEFEERVERPIVEGRLPTGPVFDLAPERSVMSWAAGVLPLSSEGRRRLGGAVSHLAALNTIFPDPRFREAFPQLSRLTPPGRFAEQLAARVAALGERLLVWDVETLSAVSVSGYVVDRNTPDVPAAVELWMDGAFAAAALANVYRRDLQERFGSSGTHGFHFEGFSPPGDARERRLKLEVRDAGSKVLLASGYAEWRPGRDAGAVAELSRQLATVRDTLERVETALHRLSGAAGFTTAAWDDYWRAYYPPTLAMAERLRAEAETFARRLSFTVALTSLDTGAAALERTLASLRAQTWRRFDLQLVTGSAEPVAAAGLAGVNAAPFDAAKLGDYVVTLDAGDLLAPDALHRFAAAAQAVEATLLYADSDTVVVTASGRERHTDPQLRPAYDPDLLLQSPYMGMVVAVRSSALRQALTAPEASLAPERRADLVLRVLEQPGAQAVAVPRVLHHAAERKGDATDYLEAVRGHLDRRAIGALAERAQDDASGGRVEVTWPLFGGVKAAVIIPTRDRLDLLGPCIASLLNARTANKTELEIVIVDNGSAEASTRRFLGALVASGGVRLLDYDGEFNWSAINNHAARAVDADVLVFLNNDTVVLEPGFADALCRQAMRLEIGAVGARLLYEDGTIQHAGVILGAGDGLGLHEGVSAAPGDGGYLDRRSLVHRASAVTGACLATRAEVFARLGGFDEEHLAIEANDLDYCVRLRRAGLAVLYEPRATLYHFESKSRGHTGLDDSRRRRAEAEIAVLRARWGAALEADPFYNAHFDRTIAPFTRLRAPPD